MPYHVSPQEFDTIAEAAMDSIPEALRQRLDIDNVLITVQREASADDRAHGIDRHTLGFFQGTPHSSFDTFEYPQRIVLLQRHIEEYCATHAELIDQVTDTVLHEVAHYFGMSHDDIAETRLRH